MKPAIILRASMYMTLAALPVPIAWLMDTVKLLSDGKPILVHWAVFLLLGLNAFYQAVLALRIYIDGSAERSRREVASTPSNSAQAAS